MRGHVPVVALGRSLDLRFTANALCRLEEVTGRGIVDLATDLEQSMRITDLRTMLWAGIPGISIEEAGDIIDEIGFERTAELIGQAITVAFPQEAASGAKAAAGNGAGAAA